MTGFLNLTEVASKRKTMIPIFWNHGLNLMMLRKNRPFFNSPEIIFSMKKVKILLTETITLFIAQSVTITVLKFEM